MLTLKYKEFPNRDGILFLSFSPPPFSPGALVGLELRRKG